METEDGTLWLRSFPSYRLEMGSKDKRKQQPLINKLGKKGMDSGVDLLLNMIKSQVLKYNTEWASLTCLGKEFCKWSAATNKILVQFAPLLAVECECAAGLPKLSAN